jgi:polar amino acid transport system substrate-binding protein
LKKSFVLLIALLVLALIAVPVVVAGCGSSSTTTTAAAATTTTAAAATTTTAAAATTTTAAAGTTTTAAAATTTTAAAAYDIQKIVAGIQPDPSILATLPDQYKNNPIKVGCDVSYPPWEMFVEGTDQVTGFDYEIALAVAAKMGVPSFQFIQASFDSILLGIDSGKYDIGMSAFTDKKSRQEKYDFVDYAQDGTGILVKKGNPENITGIMGLSGKKVGTEKGTTQADSVSAINELLKAAGQPLITASEYPDQPTNLLQLKSGNIDAIVTDASTAGYVAANTDNGATFELVNDPKPPEGWEDQPDGIAVKKGNDALRDALLKGVQGIFADGTYKTIIDHWGIVPIAQPGINLGTFAG